MRLVVLDDGLVERLANNPMVIRAFPFLSSIKTAAAKKCNCSASPDLTVTRNAVKQTVAALTAAELQKFKGFVQADRLRIFFNNGQGVSDVTI